MKLPTKARSQFLLILAVAASVRLLGILTLPLIITNDGSNYLAWGQELATGAWPDFPTTRTPGYPLLLAVIFKSLGQSAHAILIAQALLGIAISLLAWHTARTIAGNRAGLAAGVAIALEPWLFLFEHYALSETLTLFLVMLAVAAAVTVRERRLVFPAYIAGIAIAAAALTRPAMQAWVPFIFAACVLGAPTLGRCYRPAIACLIGLILLLAPWLIYNSNRNVPGIVETDGLALWGGMARAQLLTTDHDIPKSARQRAQLLFQEHPPSESEILGFYNQLAHIDNIDRKAFLSEWAKESIASNPVGYVKAAAHAALWQSNAMVPGSPYAHDELHWQMRRLGAREVNPNQAAPNLQINNQSRIDERFHDHAGIGPQAWLYRNWPIGMKRNIIHPVISVLSLVACLVLIQRKQFAPAILILGAFALVGAHALLLQPFPRYSMTAWAIWWVAAATLLPNKAPQHEHQPTTH